MDPNALLRAARQLLPDALNGDADAAETLAEVFSNLDHWLSHGGFLPEAWSPDTHKSKVRY